jgi:hypothetical protein
VALEVARVGVTPFAVGIEAPREHRERQVERAWDDALACALVGGARVDEERAFPLSGHRLVRCQAREPAARLLEHLVDAFPRHRSGPRAPASHERPTAILEAPATALA